MIVDDDLLVLKYYSVLVEWAGFDVCAVASSGHEAIDKAVELKPDVILMDVRLSGDIDGVEAAKIIHDRVGCRMIFITASNERSTINRINEDRPHTVLVKPVAPDDLRNALNS